MARQVVRELGGRVADGLRLVSGALGRGDGDGPRPAPGWLEPLEPWSHADPGGGGRPAVDVAVFVYRGVSSTEVQMVADALAAPLSAAVRLVSPDPGPIVAVEPPRTIVTEPLTAVSRPYGLVVPGGLAWKREATRPEVVAWLRQAVGHARGVIAVSTGSLLLAAIGRLDGREAAGHWLAGGLLAELGALPSPDRVVRSRLLVTASGARAGAEAAAELAREMRFSF